MTGAEQLMDAIGQLPEELIAPAAELRRKNPVVRRWLAITASFLLILGLGLSAVLTEDRAIEHSPTEAAPTEQRPPSGFVITAKVKEVQEDRVRIERIINTGFVTSAGPLWIMLTDLENPPQLEEGDRILVYYDGKYRSEEGSIDHYINVVYYIEKMEGSGTSSDFDLP